MLKSDVSPHNQVKQILHKLEQFVPMRLSISANLLQQIKPFLIAKVV